MSIFIVCYEPQRGDMNAEDFDMLLVSKCGDREQVNEAAWAVKFDGTAQDLFDRIVHEGIRSNALLFVGELTKDHVRGELYPPRHPAYDVLGGRRWGSLST